MKKITEKEADEWVRKNKHRHKWVTAKMLSYFANDKIKELNQNKDDYSFERVSTEERQRERSDKYDYLIGDDDDIKLNQNKDEQQKNIYKS